MLRAVRTEELLLAEKELPASRSILESLFDYLDEKLGDAGCDNTVGLTLEFAKLNRLDENRLCAWTEKYAGYCRCEVLVNIPDSHPVFQD